VNGQCPPLYFGGFSEDAKDVAASEADIFLTWPDTVSSVSSTVEEMQNRAATYDRELICGLRTHVIVRETEGDARTAADRLISRLDDETGAAIRSKSLDSASVGVQRQAALRESATKDGYAEDHLWTGIGRARSGAGAAIVGDPDQVLEKLQTYEQVGIGAFILSGYPHREECDLFAKHVLPRMNHSALKPRWTPSH
jgi:alkanesulfonate monooxygenase